jgi:DNA replication protein DnaC
MRLAEMEMIDRERRMVDRRIKAARFPTVKSLDSFDFLALPSLNKMLVLELARSDYVERHGIKTGWRCQILLKTKTAYITR